MENLNKENFWNELYLKYPRGMKVFCDWIDEYKKKNEWNILFNDKYAYIDNRLSTPKFYDIPLAMQIGIWIEFVCERGGCSYEVDLFDHNWKEDITDYIKVIENDFKETWSVK